MARQRGRITLYCPADSFDRKKLDEVGQSGWANPGCGDTVEKSPPPTHPLLAAGEYMLSGRGGVTHIRAPAWMA